MTNTNNNQIDATAKASSAAIVSCQLERDELIRKLWCTFRDMSDLQEPDDFTDEDMNLWELVTNHSAVQNRLSS